MSQIAQGSYKAAMAVGQRSGKTFRNRKSRTDTARLPDQNISQESILGRNVSAVYPGHWSWREDEDLPADLLPEIPKLDLTTRAVQSQMNKILRKRT